MKNSMHSFILAFFMFVTLHAQTTPGLLEVTGTATSEALPEEMLITAPLSVIDSSYMKCSEGLTAILQDLKADLESKGFDPDVITTRNFSISENYEYQQGQRIRSGYKGRVTLIVEQGYEPAMIDSFLRAAEKFSVEYNIMFMLSEEQKEKLSREAMVLAVKDASAKARILSEASGVRLKGIAKISYGEQPVRPGPLVQVSSMAADSEMSESNGLSLFPGEIAIHQSVFMAWNIEK